MKSYYFLLLIFISSCSYNGSFGGLVSCYKKTNSINSSLISTITDHELLCELSTKDVPKVYAINGVDLSECLNNYDKSIVYLWMPNCTGNFCVSLELVQQYCNVNEIEFFVVSEYYDYKKMNEVYDIDHPVFGIDIKHYRTNYTPKYRKKFVYDLTKTKNIENSMFFLFEKNILKDNHSSIDSLNLNL